MYVLFYSRAALPARDRDFEMQLRFFPRVSAVCCIIFKYSARTSFHTIKKARHDPSLYHFVSAATNWFTALSWDFRTFTVKSKICRLATAEGNADFA
jgi:hypothetical protein